MTAHKPRYLPVSRWTALAILPHFTYFTRSGTYRDQPNLQITRIDSINNARDKKSPSESSKVARSTDVSLEHSFLVIYR
jgi:hypothetical protein